MPKQSYVVGFMFDASFQYVALIRKNKPEWQAGKLNGIGGKVEEGEAPARAMVREFMEETAFVTTISRWSHFANMGAESWCVHFFTTVGEMDLLKSPEEEKVEIAHVRDFHPTHSSCIENLPWLISLAIDHLNDGRPSFATITYPS